MSDLRELYQEIILDHNRRPRNFGDLDGANHEAVGHNPLCGDRITIQVRVTDGRIEEVRFKGAGCAISKASASLMTDAIKGKTIAEVRELFDEFHHMVTADLDTIPPVDRLKKLAAFAGVREFPTRVKCASLAWHTLQAALEDEVARPVTTEA
jgi:nitrogen fixation NifU-like protein